MKIYLQNIILFFFCFFFIVINKGLASPGDNYFCTDTKGDLINKRDHTILWKRNKTFERKYFKSSPGDIGTETAHKILKESNVYFIAGEEYSDGIITTSFFDNKDGTAVVIRTYLKDSYIFSEQSTCVRQ